MLKLGYVPRFSLLTSPDPENMSILTNCSHPASIGLNAPETCLSAAGDLENLHKSVVSPPQTDSLKWSGVCHPQFILILLWFATCVICFHNKQEQKLIERKPDARRGRFCSARCASVKRALAATALCRGAAASSPPPGRRGWFIDPGFFVNPGGGASRDLTNRDKEKARRWLGLKP